MDIVQGVLRFHTYAMHFVYICHSAAIDRFYIGETEGLDQRLALHRSHAFKGATTARARDWERKQFFSLPN